MMLLWPLLFRRALAALVPMLAALFLLVALSAEAKESDIWYVTEGGTGNGQTADTPAGSGDLRRIIALEAKAGDQVWVASGRYTPTLDGGNRRVSFTLQTGIAVLGGFAPPFGEATTSVDRNPRENETLLTGDIDEYASIKYNSHHVISCDSVASRDARGHPTLLDGFTITGGCANAGSSEQGGGLHLSNSSPVISDCLIRDNHANDKGGGVYAGASSDPAFRHCRISGNTTESQGGGIHLEDSHASLRCCTLTDNNAHSGGAIYSHSSSYRLVSSTVAHNSATHLGGGIYNNWRSALTLLNSTVAGNTAGLSGGGLFHDFSDATIVGCTLAANSAGDLGSGIYSNNSGLVATNCILWNNRENEIRPDGGDFTYCIISADSPEPLDATNSNASPLLGPLADNGGATETCAIGRNGSAFNGASPDIMEDNDIDTDQRGLPRPAWGGYDIGAFELQPAVLQISTDWRGHGVISPCNPPVLAGEGISLDVSPDVGYRLASLVSGDSRGRSEDLLCQVGSPDMGHTVVFTNVTQNHTLSAAFGEQSYTIAATAGDGGRIDPSGDVTVACSEDVAFEISPDIGYLIDAVSVDGTAVGSPDRYTFHHVSADHRIEALFA
ncbi:MAG: right-handed parallel beta-helix repeat-containing protein, partial [Synergistales bacterium]|nr:right-handed parallel beta-helix repeat-containing protein [Synergistales bacterium]